MTVPQQPKTKVCKKLDWSAPGYDRNSSEDLWDELEERLHARSSPRLINERKNGHSFTLKHSIVPYGLAEVYILKQRANI